MSGENGHVSLSADSLLNASEVAALLGVPTSTVRAWARSGEMPVIRLGRHLRWTREMVEVWLTQNLDLGRR